MKYKLFTLCEAPINDGMCMMCTKARMCSMACRKICDNCLHRCECDQRVKIRARENGWCYSREEDDEQ